MEKIFDSILVISLGLAIFFLVITLGFGVIFFLGAILYHLIKCHPIHLPSLLAISCNYAVTFFIFFIATLAIDRTINLLEQTVGFIYGTVIVSLSWFAVYFPINWIRERPYHKKAFIPALRTTLLMLLIIAVNYVVNAIYSGNSEKSLDDNFGNSSLMLLLLLIGFPFFRWGNPRRITFINHENMESLFWNWRWFKKDHQEDT